jgi:HAE1 family hydrophobic/amphiphilic exporter-1
MRQLISFCVRRPVATLMLGSGLMIIGLIASAGLGVEFLPEVELPRLIVSTSFAGLPASEVRVLLSIPLEDALSSLKGIKRISSVSREGVSTVSLEFHWGTNMQMAAVECREMIDIAYPSMPSETRKPLVLPVDPGEEPVLLLGVFARDGELSFARRIAEREIKTRLQQVSGVGSITLTGGAEEEVQILVDQEKMAARGTSLEEIAGVLADSSFDYPAGLVREGPAEYLVKAEGSVKEPSALGEFSVPGAGRGRFLIRDVATVQLASKERLSLFQIDGREGVGLLIRRRQGTSPVALSAGIRSELERLRQSYGRDLELIVARDASRFITGSLRDLVLSAVLGAGIAFLVVLFFVRDLRASLILISSVPISVVISLLFLRLAGRSINVMSIGGLSMGIGMMMDNSVVILENLQKRLLQEGWGVSADNVILATDEMSGSNIGNLVTAVVVFLPVIFLPGVIGEVFTDLSLSVIFSQLTSFFVSVTLVPVLFLLAENRKRLRPLVPSRSMAEIERTFRRLSRAFLRRPAYLALVLAAATAAGLYSYRRLPFEFMPAVDTGEIGVTVTLQHGASVDYISRVSSLLSAQLLKVRGVAAVYARAGGEPDDAYYLADARERREILHLTAVLTRGRRPLAFEIARVLRQTLAVEGASISVELPENVVAPLLGLQSGSLDLKVSGQDQEQAIERAGELKNLVAGGGLFSSVEQYPAGEKPELQLVPVRDLIARAGTDLLNIAGTVRAGLEGLLPTQMVIDGREVDVRLRLHPSDTSTLERVGRFLVRGPDGAMLRLSDLVNVREVSRPPALVRVDRSDVAFVEASPRSGARRQAQRFLDQLQASRPYAESLETSVLRENLSAILATFGLVVLLLYLALGAQFESFLLPLLLLSSLPLSLLGIFAALYLGGKSLNFDSLLGIIVLFGIAVNNSIVLYENYRQRISSIQRGSILIAIYRGTSERLRPILITMLTTVMALVPIAVDTSQTSTQSSMAVAVIGGLFVSTTLTLFVIPQLFYLYLRRRRGAS